MDGEIKKEMRNFLVYFSGSVMWIKKWMGMKYLGG